MESEAHILLKEQARKSLLAMGFKPSEIHEEYHVKEVNLIADIVGISDYYSIAIECGNLSVSDKMEVLTPYFDKVTQLQYINNKISRITKDERTIKQISDRGVSFTEIALDHLEVFARAEKSPANDRLITLIRYFRYQENMGDVRKKHYESYSPGPFDYMLPSQRKNLQTVLRIIGKLQTEVESYSKTGVPVDDIVRQAEIEDIEKDSVLIYLAKMNQMGDIYKTGATKYKSVDLI